eukprot:scaffold392_cov194-Ochromonas_danica.AAC.1
MSASGGSGIGGGIGSGLGGVDYSSTQYSRMISDESSPITPIRQDGNISGIDYHEGNSELVIVEEEEELLETTTRTTDNNPMTHPPPHHHQVIPTTPVIDESVLLGGTSPLKQVEHEVVGRHEEEQSIVNDSISWLVSTSQPNQKIRELRAQNKELKELVKKLLDAQSNDIITTTTATNNTQTSKPLITETVDNQLLDSLRESVDVLSQERVRLQEQINGYKEEIHHLQELCETKLEVGRQQALVVSEHQIQLLTQQLTALSEEKSTLSSTVSSLTSQLQLLEENAAKHESVEGELDELRQQISRYRK